MTRRQSGVSALVAASLALGFVLGWTEHRPAHHITRLDEQITFCRYTAEHTWHFKPGAAEDATVAKCALQSWRWK